MSNRPECAECPLSDAFDGLDEFAGLIQCCGAHEPDAPRCESCGVPLVRHLGLTGTCAEKQRYLGLLRTTLGWMRKVDLWQLIDECPDVAEFLREEEGRKG